MRVPPLTYVEYGNPRFAFSVDAPAFFHEEPAPTNGDGQEWTWGSHARMTASGMHGGFMTIADLCQRPPDEKARRKARTETKTMCWVTGVTGGRIYWEKTVLSGPFLYSLRFEYDEALKTAFDPLVAHVNASWHYRTCGKDRIDACEMCYPRCRVTADCKGNGDVCKPVKCGPDALGNDPDFGLGCVNPDDEFSVHLGALRVDDAPTPP